MTLRLLTRTTVLAVFLGGIMATLVPADAAKAPPKPKRACPAGEVWVFQSKFLNEPAHWACVPRKQPTPK